MKKKPFSAATSASSSAVRTVLFSSRPQQSQVHPMSSPNPKDNHNKDHDHDHGHGLEAFQRSVAERFAALASGDEGKAAPLLSLSWLRLAVETALGCDADFRRLVPRPWSQPQALSKAEERIADDFLERSVKALDLCNAIRDGIDHVRRWQRHVEIVLCALDLRQRSPLGEPQLRRARKAVGDLLLAIGEDNPAAAVLAQYRHRSFCRPSAASSSASAAAASHFRSQSWSVSRSWSAGRQLQVMGSNLVPPKSETASGFAVPAYTMNVVVLFAMWALVAAIPCQDRGLQAHFSVPRNSFPWAAPLLSIYERVMEESRHHHRRGGGSGGAALLKEISEISACVRRLSDVVESCLAFPLTEVQDREIKKEVLGLMQLWAAMKEGLDPLEKQVRELFHKIVRTRTEVLDCLSRNNSSDR